MTTPAPEPPGRDEAREAALRELADPVYAADDPSWPERALRWVLDRLGELLDALAEAAPGGYGGLLVLLALVVVAVIAIRLRTGRIGRRTGAERAGLFEAAERSAAEHRRAADRHADRGEWADAVRERLRAIIRGLEERDLLAPATGRTADEAAELAGRELPDCAAGLHAAARTFDEVSYGGRTADAAADAQLREVDTAVRTARPTAATTAPAPR